MERELVKKESHNWAFELSFACAEKYDQFVNWLSYEFYLFQQDQEPLFTIYFPNGRVRILKEEEDGRKLFSKLIIESRCKKAGLTINQKLSAFLNHIEGYHQLS